MSRRRACCASAETYTRLSYIECAGEQYINLDYIVQETDVINMGYKITSTTSADKFLFGTAEGSNGLWISQYSSSVYIRFGHTASVTVSTIRTSTSLTLQKGKLTTGSTTKTLSFTAMPNTPLHLFAGRTSSGGAYAYGYLQCSSFSIANNGVIKMSLIPVRRDSDGKLGMLDEVSGKFYSNQGTGDDFIAGAIV